MSITNLKLNQIILEELEDERYSIIYNQECQRIDRLHEEIDKERRLLTEAYGLGLGLGVPEWMVHLGLDVIGFLPGVGAPADLFNAYLYATKDEYLMAALSIISVIPVLGDAIAMAGKGVALGAKSAKAAASTGKFGKLIAKHMKTIEATFKGLEKTPLIGPHVPKMLSALKSFGKRAVLQPKHADVIADAAKFRSVKEAEVLAKGSSKVADWLARFFAPATYAAGKAGVKGVKAGLSAKAILKNAAEAGIKAMLAFKNPIQRAKAFKKAYMDRGVKYFGRDAIPKWFFKALDKELIWTGAITGYGRVIPGFGKAWKVGQGGGKGFIKGAIGKVVGRELVRYGPLGWPGHIIDAVTSEDPAGDPGGPSAKEWKEMVEKGTAQAWCDKNPNFECFRK